MTDDRQKVLDATDIADLVGEHLSLKPRGAEFVGLCPFHDDHTPSMAVVPRKGIFYCFSCGAGGNAIDFMMKYHGMGFREALKALAERAGVELTPMRGGGDRPQRRRSADEHGHTHEDFGPSEFVDAGASRDELARANAFAQSLFRGMLRHQEHGEAARRAIAARGIPEHIVERFALGASPDRWDGLIKTAQAKGFSLRLLEAAGLTKRRPTGDGAYDTFRHRLMFPIQDQLGRVIAFGARKIRDEDEPKYLNSPESDLFDKGSTLYALGQATPAIKRERFAIVTEGYMDAIACHAAGVEQVVATLGTAMTLRHAKLLRRLCDRVVLLFDGDEAGQRAADRAVEVLLAEPIDVQVAVLPEGQDPDDLLKSEGGREAFMDVVHGGEDALRFRHRRLEAKLRELGAGPGSATRARLVEEDVQRLVELGLDRLSPIRRQGIVRRLASIARVDERSILEAIGRSRRSPRAQGEGASGSARAGGSGARVGGTRSPVEHAIGCLLAHPELFARDPGNAGAALDAGALKGNPPTLRAIAGALAELLEDADLADEPGVSRLIAELSPEARAHATALITIASGSATAETLDVHWRDCALECRRVVAMAEAGEGDGFVDIPQDDGSMSGGGHEMSGSGEAESARALADRIARIRTLGGNPRSLPGSSPNS
ncbi:MAG: DNA primase [Phycisphaerales bacterium]